MVELGLLLLVSGTSLLTLVGIVMDLRAIKRTLSRIESHQYDTTAVRYESWIPPTLPPEMLLETIKTELGRQVKPKASVARKKTAK